MPHGVYRPVEKMGRQQSCFRLFILSWSQKRRHTGEHQTHTEGHSHFGKLRREAGNCNGRDQQNCPDQNHQATGEFATGALNHRHDVHPLKSTFSVAHDQLV